MRWRTFYNSPYSLVFINFLFACCI